MSHQRAYFRSLSGAKPQGSPTPHPTDRLALEPLFLLLWSRGAGPGKRQHIVLFSGERSTQTRKR
jgi:hypothetical protein